MYLPLSSTLIFFWGVGGAFEVSDLLFFKVLLSCLSSLPHPIISQVSTAGSSSLLGSAPSLPLGFGMLGGLVPVSLPFQFPPLLNLPPLGTAGSSTAASGSVASSNATFSTLTQSE